ncbi:glycosyltransferase [Sinorhizobium meliloti]|nr:glycosyltransferase [Sinorhizobium meliloti]
MKQKVVIVFPVYNGEKTLISSLRSIADQTFGEFEAIILDNKSVDNTFSLAEQFCRSDRRFSLIRNEQHLSAIEKLRKSSTDRRRAWRIFLLARMR